MTTAARAAPVVLVGSISVRKIGVRAKVTADEAVTFFDELNRFSP